MSPDLFTAPSTINIYSFIKLNKGESRFQYIYIYIYRMRLIPFFIFAVVMTGFIYPVQGYWKWGGGWLDAIGYTDFAGSGVVHLCGASAALAAVLILGARSGSRGV